MEGVSQAELDALARQHPVTHAHMSATPEGRWIVVFEIATRPGKSRNQYQLVSQRGWARTWADPRALLRYIRTRYGVLGGSFDISALSVAP